MNENFGPAPGAYTPEELLAIEGYTPEHIEAIRQEKTVRLDQIESERKARLAQELHVKEQVTLAKPEVMSITVLLGNGKTITFKDVADVEPDSETSEGFRRLVLISASDNVIAEFEPTTWAAYYSARHCSGIQNL